MILVPTSLVWHYWGTTLSLGNQTIIGEAISQWRQKYPEPERKLYKFFESVPMGSHIHFHEEPKVVYRDNIAEYTIDGKTHIVDLETGNEIHGNVRETKKE